MARSSSLGAPLVGTADEEHKRWRRPLMSIVVVASAVVVVALGGFLLMHTSHAAVVSESATSTLSKAPTSVSKLLEIYARPTSIKHVNALLEALPVHDVEELVFYHIKPSIEHLFHSFLKHYGSTAPHFKTGKKLKRRHNLEDENELRYRLNVFEEFLQDVIRLNNFEARHNPRSDRAVFGVTKFADWTFEEFQTLLKGPATKLNTTVPPSKMLRADKGSKQSRKPSPPCTKNWAAEHPDVFAPRDQGSCGACYTFAAAEELRALAFLNTGIDQGELSVQYVLDCKGDGCSGGDAGDVMEWVRQKGGIPRKVDYGPYHAHKTQCKAGIPNSVTTAGAERFHDEEATANKLCGSGPLSMGLYANDAFRAYRHGVLSHHSCHATSPNHDTQVVGVLEDKGAFLIRNSWGSDWGVNPITLEPDSDGGFILLEYGHNTCDITDCNSFPLNVTCVGNCSDHPTPAPPTPAPPGYVCSNSCQYADDGACDDGGPGSSYSACHYGQDCDDCGARPPLAPPTPAPPGYICSNSCQYADDGACDDGGPGSSYNACHYGQDCDDCGGRPPLAPPTPAPNGYVCSNTCRYADDGACDDGGPGSSYHTCSYGSDCDDCGSRPPLPPTTPPPDGSVCSNTCQYAHDHDCDDGGPGSAYNYCRYGTDCDDCGFRPTTPPPTPAPPSPPWDVCSNSCQYADDGACDDGGPGSSYHACHYGQDCDDCGSRPPKLPHICIPFTDICVH